MTRCESCGHEFHNVLRKTHCPNCGQALKKEPDDEAFDATGFAFGLATGVPLSPTYGFSTGAMLGAALHPSPTKPDELASVASSAPDNPPAPSHESSSSYDTGGSPPDSSGGSPPDSSPSSSSE